jgi:hypothetical protein
MFSFGRRDEVSPTHQVLKLSLSSPKNAKKMNKFYRKQNQPGRERNDDSALHKDDPRLHRMNVHNTTDGVEVSLDLFKGGGPASPLETREQPQVPIRAEPVISLQSQVRKLQRVHKAQFSVNFSANSAPEAVSPMAKSPWSFGGQSPNSQQEQQQQQQQQWRPKDHRIPLHGMAPVEAAFEDVLNLLQHSHVADEYTAVHQEFEQMNAEMEALERDRDYLQANLNTQSMSPTAARSPISQLPSIAPLSVDWDVQKVLDSARLTDAERRRLEAKRGDCFTMCFGNPRAREVFLTKCNAKLSDLLKTHSGSPKKRGTRIVLPPSDCLTLGPHNCRAGGAASSIRQVTLLKDSGSSHGSKNNPMSPSHQISGFFLSRDAGKAQTWGRIPSKLYRRIKEEAGASQCDFGDLVRLSTGPLGCYFAEFRSGETWWGSPVMTDDTEDFHSILKTWDVYKVVFGPLTTMEDKDSGSKRLVNSWIIIGRDGRVAWKNIPPRLKNRLESRLADWAALSDVSLGLGGSYFCRFLDGSIDYCVPASVASVCEYIECNGGTITELSLHPEISNDFLIRHTEFR